jgi:replicative DNA helicase
MLEPRTRSHLVPRHLHAVTDPYQPEDTDHHPVPHDPDAERAVIGAVILGGPAALAEISDLIGPEDLYIPAHETIMNALCTLADRGRPTDAIALANALGPDLSKVGGPPYLHTCMEAVPTSANGAYYAEIVREKAYLRAVVTVGTRIAQMGRTEYEPDLKTAIEREIMTLLQRPVRGWSPAVPLTGTSRTAPAFPLSALPSWTRAKVEAVAHDTQTPPDLAATIALACLSTAAGGHVSVLVRPEIGWREPVNLYTVAALPPGSRKSPAFSSLTAPITAAESELVETLLPEITTLRVDKKAAEDSAARAADQLAKANVDEYDGARFEAHQAALAAEAITVPAIPRLFVDDVTPEALASILAEQGGSLAILSAESEVFNVIAGRYSGTPNMNVFLKGHAGDALRVDRRGRPPETIERPALTLGICTQPSALADLAAIPGAAGRGLLARFLFTVPDVAIGSRPTDPEPANPAAHTAWTLKLRALLSACASCPSRSPSRSALAPTSSGAPRARTSRR